MCMPQSSSQTSFLASHFKSMAIHWVRPPAVVGIGEKWGTCPSHSPPQPHSPLVQRRLRGPGRGLGCSITGSARTYNPHCPWAWHESLSSCLVLPSPRLPISAYLYKPLFFHVSILSLPRHPRFFKIFINLL